MLIISSFMIQRLLIWHNSTSWSVHVHPKEFTCTFVAIPVEFPVKSCSMTWILSKHKQLTFSLLPQVSIEVPVLLLCLFAVRDMQNHPVKSIFYSTICYFYHLNVICWDTSSPLLEGIMSLIQWKSQSLLWLMVVRVSSLQFHFMSCKCPGMKGIGIQVMHPCLWKIAFPSAGNSIYILDLICLLTFWLTFAFIMFCHSVSASIPTITDLWTQMHTLMLFLHHTFTHAHTHAR